MLPRMCPVQWPRGSIFVFSVQRSKEQRLHSKNENDAPRFKPREPNEKQSRRLLFLKRHQVTLLNYHYLYYMSLQF